MEAATRGRKGPSGAGIMGLECGGPWLSGWGRTVAREWGARDGRHGRAHATGATVGRMRTGCRGRAWGTLLPGAARAHGAGGADG